MGYPAVSFSSASSSSLSSSSSSFSSFFLFLFVYLSSSYSSAQMFPGGCRNLLLKWGVLDAVNVGW